MLGFLSKERKRKEAQIHLSKIINNHCPRMLSQELNDRGDSRMSLALPILVIPVRGNVPDCSCAFATVTRELSATGLSVVTMQQVDAEAIVVGLNWNSNPTFFWTTIRHQDPIGAGLWQAGLLVDQIVAAGDYAGLSQLEF